MNNDDEVHVGQTLKNGVYQWFITSWLRTYHCWSRWTHGSLPVSVVFSSLKRLKIELVWYFNKPRDLRFISGDLQPTNLKTRHSTIKTSITPLLLGDLETAESILQEHHRENFLWLTKMVVFLVLITAHTHTFTNTKKICVCVCVCANIIVWEGREKKKERKKENIEVSKRS